MNKAIYAAIPVLILVVVLGSLYVFKNWDFVTPTNPGPDGGEINNSNHTEPQSTLPISISPSTVSVSVGDEFSIDISVFEAKNLYGYEYDLSYDPEIIELLSVTEGEFLKRGAETNCITQNTDVPGLVENVACTRLTVEDGVSGNGVLSSVSFRAKSPGDSEIRLFGVKLSNPLAQAITPQISSGEVIVNE